MSVNVTKAGNWYVQYAVPGKSPEKEYFGQGPAAKQKAEIRDLEIKAAKKKGDFYVVVEERMSDDPFIDELTQGYLKDLKRMGKDKRYRKMIASQANNSWVKILGDKPVSQLKNEDFNALYDSYESLTENSKTTYFAMLNAILNYGVNEELIEGNPLKKWKKKHKLRYKRRELALKLCDLNKLVAVAEEPLKFALQILWELGVRPGPSELYKLKWSDISWDAKQIHVRGTKTEKSDRHLPITDEFVELLKERQQYAQSEYLVELKGKPVQRLAWQFEKACKKAEIDYPVCLYSVRHLYASELLRNGAEIAAVASLLGHSNIQTLLKVYHHVLQGEKERAILCKPKLEAA